MNNLSFWSSMATIIGIPISLIGLLFAYLSLRGKHRKTTQCVSHLKQQIQQIDTRFETFSEIVNLHNKYLSSGAQYHNCTFTNVPLGSKQLDELYTKGEETNG